MAVGKVQQNINAGVHIERILNQPTLFQMVNKVKWTWMRKSVDTRGSYRELLSLTIYLDETPSSQDPC